MVDSVNNQPYPGFLDQDLSSLSELNDDAIKRLVEEYQNADRGFESVDVAKNPSKYTAEQKLIYLLDLLQSRANYGSYQETVKNYHSWYGTDAATTSNVFIRTNGEILADYDRAISALQGDADTQGLLNQKIMAEIKEIFASGGDAETYAKVKRHFEENVVSGKMLEDALAEGKSLKEAIELYTSALYFYSQIIPDADFKALSDEASAAYGAFLEKHLIDGTSFGEALDGLLDGTEEPGDDVIPSPMGRILPTIAADRLAGGVFGDGLYDSGLMKALADRMDLFDPAIAVMARQMYAGNGAAADQFSAKVKELLADLWGRMANGEIGAEDLPGLIDQALARAPTPAGVDADAFKEAVEQAVTALMQGGALASQAAPTDIGQPLVTRDASGKFVRRSGLNTYTDGQIAAMIAAATGLAGRSIGSTDNIGVSPTLFGNDANKAWDKAMSKTFAFDDVVTASDVITTLTRDRAGDGIGVQDPVPVKGSYGYDRVLPGVDAGRISEGIFGENVYDLYDRNLAQALADKLELFRPTIETLAERLYGGTPEVADEFTRVVTKLLPGMLERLASGTLTPADLEARLDKALYDLKIPQGVDPATYKQSVKDAVTALVRGGALVSQAQPTDVGQPLVVRDANGDFVRQSGLNTYSDGEIAAMIAVATGLAGRGITQDYASTPSRHDMNETMFGTHSQAWDQELTDRFALTDLEKGAGQVLDLVQNRGSDLEITEPKKTGTPTDGVTKAARFEKVFGETISKMGDELFAGNVNAQAQFRMNVMGLIRLVWNVGKPGGDLTSIRDLLKDKQWVQDRLGGDNFTPPDGVARDKYLDIVTDAVNALVNGGVVAYRIADGRITDWASLAGTVLFGVNVATSLMKASGKFLSEIDDVSKFMKFAQGWKSSSAKTLIGDTLKTGSNVIGGAAGLAWVPLEIYWLIDAFKNGDAGDKTLMTVAVAADTVLGITGAITAAADVIDFLVPAELSIVRMLNSGGPSLLTKITVVGTLISNLAWIGLELYNDIKETKQFDKATDRMSDETERLLDDPILFNGPRPVQNPPDWSPW